MYKRGPTTPCAYYLVYFSELTNIYFYLLSYCFIIFLYVPRGGAILVLLSVQFLSILCLPCNATLFSFVLPVGFLIKRMNELINYSIRAAIETI